MIFDNSVAFITSEFIFQTHEENHPPPPSILPPCPPQDFHGASPAQMMRRSMSFSGVGSKYEEMLLQAEDEVSDDGSPLGEKKKRLNIEQVKALEKSFELQGNKLESERKMQLARALGLQPRQVAIWFQNRRARYKTKQLEKDYDLLKRKFDALKADNDSLLSQNRTLQAQLLALKGESTGIGPINLNKGTEVSWSNGSDNSCDVNLGTTTTPPSTDGPLYSHHQSNKHLFQFSCAGSATITHLLQSSSRSDLQSQKIDRTLPDESFRNNVLTCCIEDDQPGFWPWPEHQN